MAVAFPLAEACAELGEFGKAIGVLVPLWERTHDRGRIHLADLLVRVLEGGGERDRAAAILDEVAAKLSDDPEVALVLAAHRLRSGDRDGAESLFRDALMRAGGNVRDRIAMQLANVLVEGGAFSEAADLYGSIVKGSEPRGIARQLLLTLYKAGRYREAWEVGTCLQEAGDNTEHVCDLRARLLEFAGELSAAKRIYLDLSARPSAAPDHALHAAQLAYRLGAGDEARQIVETLSEDRIRAQPWVMMSVAQLRAFLGMDGAVELAYRARRLAFNTPAIHALYNAIIHRLEMESRLPAAPTEVGVGTAVTLVRDGEHRTFVILADRDADLAHDEVKESDPVARKLLGLGVGDDVLLGPVTPGRTPFTIQEVRWASARGDAVLRAGSGSI